MVVRLGMHRFSCVDKLILYLRKDSLRFDTADLSDAAHRETPHSPIGPFSSLLFRVDKNGVRFLPRVYASPQGRDAG